MLDVNPAWQLRETSCSAGPQAVRVGIQEQWGTWYMDMEGLLSSLWGAHRIPYRLSSTCPYTSSPLSGRKAPGCGWVMAEAVRGVREPCTPQSGAHTSRVQVTWRTTDSRGSAGAGQQDRVRGRDGCSGAWTRSWCRGCWAEGCSAHLWPEESAGHFSQISMCGWTASWASGNLPSCFTPEEAWPLNDCVVGV